MRPGIGARGRRNECLPYTGLNSDTRHHPEHGTRTMRPGVTEGPHMNLASRLCRTWGPASLCPWERVAGGRASPVLASEFHWSRHSIHRDAVRRQESGKRRVSHAFPALPLHFTSAHPMSDGVWAASWSPAGNNCPNAMDKVRRLLKQLLVKWNLSVS